VVGNVTARDPKTPGNGKKTTKGAAKRKKRISRNRFPARKKLGQEIKNRGNNMVRPPKKYDLHRRAWGLGKTLSGGKKQQRRPQQKG